MATVTVSEVIDILGDAEVVDGLGMEYCKCLMSDGSILILPCYDSEFWKKGDILDVENSDYETVKGGDVIAG